MAAANIPRNDLVEGYLDLHQKVTNLWDNILHLQSQQKKLSLPKSGVSSRIQALFDSDITSETSAAGLPSDTRSLVRIILTFSEKAIDLVVADLEDHFRCMQEAGVMNHAQIRNVLVCRIDFLKDELPDTVHSQCELGFMHFEHENLDKEYTNKVTMIMSSPLKEVSRDEFYMTEDNCAWDMSELAEAIVSNGGVMRNPLSKEMFTPKDIQAILKHPRGKKLSALQVEQQQLSHGVRKETIAWIEKLAESMEVERGRDWEESWDLIQEFQRYVALLPEHEQKTIRTYRCPMAFDSHARKAYDTTIQEVLDGVFNGELCVHKGSDYLRQSAAYLRAPPSDGSESDKSEQGCLMM